MSTTKCWVPFSIDSIFMNEILYWYTILRGPVVSSVFIRSSIVGNKTDILNVKDYHIWSIPINSGCLACPSNTSWWPRNGVEKYDIRHPSYLHLDINRISLGNVGNDSVVRPFEYVRVMGVLHGVIWAERGACLSGENNENVSCKMRASFYWSGVCTFAGLLEYFLWRGIETWNWNRKLIPNAI